MPIVSLHPSFTAIHGRVGDVVFKTYRDKVVVTRVPCFDGYVPTTAQRAQRTRLQDATAYAKRVYADPVAKAAYIARAQTLGRQPFRLAIADYLHDPTVADRDRFVATVAPRAAAASRTTQTSPAVLVQVSTLTHPRTPSTLGTQRRHPPAPGRTQPWTQAIFSGGDIEPAAFAATTRSAARSQRFLARKTGNLVAQLHSNRQKSSPAIYEHERSNLHPHPHRTPGCSRPG